MPLVVHVGDNDPSRFSWFGRSAAEHKAELREDWELAALHQPLKKIAPLE